MDRLAGSRVAVFGVGGVGGYAVEVLARSGVGAIDVIDNDCVSPSNINRQIVALTTNVGRLKVEVAAERIRAINPACVVRTWPMFYLVSNADELDLSVYDYVADCIDTVSAKMELIRRCTRLGVPIICSMGAAFKLDASAFRVADITKTMMDPLARVIRKRLRREGIHHFKCVYSPEKPIIPDIDTTPTDEAAPTEVPQRVPPSNAWAPAAAGLILASEIVKDLSQINPTESE